MLVAVVARRFHWQIHGHRASIWREMVNGTLISHHRLGRKMYEERETRSFGLGEANRSRYSMNTIIMQCQQRDL